MELGQFSNAAEILRNILSLKPCDAVALTSLGLCLSALGHASANEKTNYALKIKLMDDPTDLANSVDPGELLEAGSTFNLSNIFYQVSPRSTYSLS
jgi:hypothetical protein